MSDTHIFALLMNVSNLEPYVLFRERSGRVLNNVFEALTPDQQSGSLDRMGGIPLDSGRTSAAVCKLCPGGSKFHLPSRNLAACA